MFRKVWRRLTQSNEPASSVREYQRNLKVDVPRPEHLPFYWLDRNTGESYLIDTPAELANLHLYQGDAYYQNGAYFEAVAHLSEVIKVVFGTAYIGQKYAIAALAYGKRGNVYFNTGNYDKAIEDYNRAIEIEPDVFAMSPLYVSRGKAYIRKDDTDKAIQDLDKAISLGGGSAEAYFDRGHAHTNKGEFGEAARDFGKANDLDPDFVYAYMTRVCGVALDERNITCSPYEIIGRIREKNIGLGVIEFISAIGCQWGFPKASGNSTLGTAAAGVSFYLAGADISPEQVTDVFSQRVRQSEYNGWAVAPYYREVYSMDTPDEKIIADMTDVLSRQIGNVAYEDFGLGITHGYPNDDHSRFGVCIVLGVGCTDGSAYALARINEVRASVGVAPLEPHASLRSIARNYILMNESPSDDQFNRDMQESGYADNALSGTVVRHGYSGAYAAIPEGLDVPNYEDMGKLAASSILNDHSDDLLRSDWQHIGIAVRLVNNPTYGRSVQSEVITAWQLPQGAERPDHFPPPIGESMAN